MNFLSDDIFVIRRQLNELYRLVGKANLYVNHLDARQVNIDMLKAKLKKPSELRSGLFSTLLTILANRRCL